MKAAELGNVDIARLLLERGADVNTSQSPPAWHRKAIKLLRKRRADGKALHSFALGRAAAAGHADVVKLLLENGGNVNQADMWGETALQLAEKNGHTDVVNMLRAAGAGQNSK